MPFFKKSKQVKIVPNQDFLHERDRYTKGETYKVELRLARYFERCGWLEGSLRNPPVTAENLAINESEHGSTGGF